MNVRNLLGIYALLLVLSSPLFLHAGELETSFDAGNAAYSTGDYAKAIETYETILSQEGKGSGLLYNLANSYAQKGEFGLAVLNYERALKLRPTDPDILGNLAKVRKDRGLFIEEPRAVERFFSILSIDGWTWGAFAGLLILVIVLSLRFKCKGRLKSFPIVGCSAACLLTLGVIGTVYRYQTYNPQVVIAGDVKLQISPFEGATAIGAIEEGRLLFSVKQHGDYTYVRDRAGRKGWLKNESVEAVCRKK